VKTESMKLKSVLLAAFCLMWIPVTSTVTSAEPTPLRAQVPFAFAVGNTWFPAGNYVIRYDNDLLNIKAEKINSIFLAQPEVGMARQQPKLQFRLSGEGYRLCTVPGIVTNYCK